MTDDVVVTVVLAVMDSFLISNKMSYLSRFLLQFLRKEMCG